MTFKSYAQIDIAEKIPNKEVQKPETPETKIFAFNKFFECDNGRITIFGLTAFITWDGKWAFVLPDAVIQDIKKAFPDAKEYFICDPEDSVIQEINNVIKTDIALGKYKLISHIRMTNRVAVLLFLATIITKEHFLTAECLYDSAGNPYIKLSGVFFEYTPFKVTIYPEQAPIPELLEKPFATMDEFGNVV